MKAVKTRSGSGKFLRKSITVPRSLESHIARRVSEPEHREQFSTYITCLIMRDKRRAEIVRLQKRKPQAQAA